MFRSIWFWVIAILLGLALWFGRDQISSYFDNLPMSAQKRTTNTQQLAGHAITPIFSAMPVSTKTGVVKSSTLIASSASTSSSGGAPAPKATSSPQYATYVVKKGDTLYSIAKRYKTTVAELQRINGISDPTALAVGQELKAPKPTSPPAPTQPGPKAGAIAYKVQQGDTVSSIARKFSTSAGALQKLNHFDNPNELVTGSNILVPATSTPPTSATPFASKPGETVHALPELSTPSLSGAATTVRPTGPPATPTPSPIPTMPSVCDGAQEAVFVWGVSFCVPAGWALQEYSQPHRTALLTRNEPGGDLSVYAISRLNGSPNAPLSWSMRQAKKDVNTEIAAVIPGGLTAPAEWTLAAGVTLANLPGQMSEARATYLKSGHAVHVRVIVFNHQGRRWRISIVAPESLWQSYNVSVFPFIARTMEVF